MTEEKFDKLMQDVANILKLSGESSGQLKIIDKRLSLIEQRLANIEQWIPVDNKSLVYMPQELATA
jgi:hypothetical protein